MMKFICKKKTCKWRIDCGNGKAMCIWQHCPDRIKINNLPTMKFAKRDNYVPLSQQNKTKN